MEPLTKEKLESWYTPKEPKKLLVRCECLSEEEELVAEETRCIDCDGTGEVDNLIFDQDSKEWIVDGSKKCICQLETNIEYHD